MCFFHLISVQACRTRKQNEFSQPEVSLWKPMLCNKAKYVNSYRIVTIVLIEIFSLKLGLVFYFWPIFANRFQQLLFIKSISSLEYKIIWQRELKVNQNIWFPFYFTWEYWVCIKAICQKHQWIVIWWKWICLTGANLHKKFSWSCYDQASTQNKNVILIGLCISNPWQEYSLW